MSSNIFQNETEEYKLERNIILPNFYDTNHFHIQEKNWSFVEYNSELHIVYKWYPLQLGKINYERKYWILLKSNTIYQMYLKMQEVVLQDIFMKMKYGLYYINLNILQHIRNIIGNINIFLQFLIGI